MLNKNNGEGNKKHHILKRYWVKIAIFSIIVLLIGAIGGIGGILVLSSDNGALIKKLGFSNIKGLSIPLTKTDKIVLEESNAIIDSSKKVSPAVVSITLKTQVQDIFGQVSTQQGAGTGFIITSDGLILTNRHVASDENTTYTAILSDGKIYDAKIQSVDSVQDIAVLKIEARDLPVVELGDSDQLQIGQWVVAVGNALGQYQNTVTVGVVSGRNRKVEASDASGANAETLDNMIQTDAAINPGNSGGPLVNIQGQVVGINTAVASSAQSIGFAIPINAAKSAIDSIKKTGRIVRPYLGVRYIPITPDIAKENSLPYEYGALIMRGQGLGQVAVVPGSPADKAGLKENDIILEVNGERIDQNKGLVGLVQQYNVGDKIELKVYSGGKEKNVEMTLEERK